MMKFDNSFIHILHEKYIVLNLHISFIMVSLEIRDEISESIFFLVSFIDHFHFPTTAEHLFLQCFISFIGKDHYVSNSLFVIRKSDSYNFFDIKLG
jgi:hypothetical protein